MSKISLIINTASMDPIVAAQSNMFRRSRYGDRVENVRRLAKVAGDAGVEVIVAGNFEEGDGYTYVELEPGYRDRRDALWQREMGARYSTGDVLIFCHDDHSLDAEFVNVLRRRYLQQSQQEWDLIVPKRIHNDMVTELNNGKDEDYMGGHALVMKRWLWARVPWMSVNTEWWDTTMTRLWREAGGRIVWVDDLVHVDMEAEEGER